MKYATRSIIDIGVASEFIWLRHVHGFLRCEEHWVNVGGGGGGGGGLAILKWYEMIDVTSFEFPTYYISSWLNSITVFITFISYVYWFDIFRLRYTCMQRFKNVPGWRGGGCLRYYLRKYIHTLTDYWILD